MRSRENQGWDTRTENKPNANGMQGGFIHSRMLSRVDEEWPGRKMSTPQAKRAKAPKAIPHRNRTSGELDSRSTAKRVEKKTTPSVMPTSGASCTVR